jgi:hypothetical protein
MGEPGGKTRLGAIAIFGVAIAAARPLIAGWQGSVSGTNADRVLGHIDDPARNGTNNCGASGRLPPI